MKKRYYNRFRNGFLFGVTAVTALVALLIMISVDSVESLTFPMIVGAIAFLWVAAFLTSNEDIILRRI